MTEELEEMREKAGEMFERHGVKSLLDWLVKLDKRVSDIEEKLK